MRHGVQVAIVAAMEEEVRPLFDRLSPNGTGDALLPSDALGRSALGTLAGKKVAVAIVGDGAVRARQGILALLRQVSAQRVCVAGFAGALSPGARVGEVNLISRVSSPRLPELVPSELSPWGQRAPLWSAPKLLATAGEKDSLYRQVFGGTGPALVDLETYAIAELLASRSLPWHGIRVVSDGADEDLPRALTKSMRGDGSLDRGRLVFQAIRRPSELRSLWNLRQTAETCAEALSDACCTLLAELPDTPEDQVPGPPKDYPAAVDPVDTPGGPQSLSRSDDHVRSRRLSSDPDPNTKRRLEVL